MKYLNKLFFILVIGLYSNFALPQVEAISDRSTIPVDLVNASKLKTTAFPKTNAVKRINFSFPTLFEENIGQTNQNMRYLARGSGHTIGFTKSGFDIALVTKKPDSNKQDQHRFKISLVKPKSTKPKGAKRLSTKVHQYVGKESQWIKNIPAFQSLNYNNVYKGTRMFVRGDNGEVEYGFELTKKAKVSDIKFKVDGATKLKIDKAGNLRLYHDDRYLLHTAPVFEEKISGESLPLKGRYFLYSDKEYGFKTAKRTRGAALVIDPRIVFQSFFGTQNNDSGAPAFSPFRELTNEQVSLSKSARWAELTARGLREPISPTRPSEVIIELPCQFTNSCPIDLIFLAGTSTSLGNLGSRDASISGFEISAEVMNDAIPSGDSISLTEQYRVFIGGTESGSTSTAVEGAFSGQAYLAGTTLAPDFPITQGAIFGSSDALGTGFIVHLDRQGEIISSTLLDDDSIHVPAGMKFIPHNRDGAGFLLVAGTARDERTSNATEDAYQQNPGADESGFIAAVNLNLTEYQRYSYLGNSEFNQIMDVGLDIQRNEQDELTITPIVVGATTQHDFPITTRSIQDGHSRADIPQCSEQLNSARCSDAFVAKFSLDLDELIFSALIGSDVFGVDEPGTSLAKAMDVANNGDVVLTGVTGPVSQLSAFVMSLIGNTLGANNSFQIDSGPTLGDADDVFIDAGNTVHTVGSTSVGGLQTTPNSLTSPVSEFRGTFGPGESRSSDLYYARFSSLENPFGRFNYDYFNYIGGNGLEQSAAIIGYEGCRLIAGTTNSFTLPDTPDDDNEGNLGSFSFFLTGLCDINPDIGRVSISKTVEPATVNEGEMLEFTVVIGNNNDAPIGLTFQDDLPPSLEAINVPGSLCSNQGNPVLCELDIDAGNTATIRIQATGVCTDDSETGTIEAVNTASAVQLGVGGILSDSVEYSINCKTEPGCGNAILEDGEACDDGNENDGDGCSTSCLLNTRSNFFRSVMECKHQSCECRSSSECEGSLVCGEFHILMRNGAPGLRTLPACIDPAGPRGVPDRVSP